MSMKDKLIHKSYRWHCDEDDCGYTTERSTENEYIMRKIDEHFYNTRHHKGVLTINEMVETWK